ncbi:MAG: ribosome recycling factor [Armatimonadota bacterium]|nr:ribosome recycling factor [Armatimonadota bacterium]MDR7402760.1 ribosome recycling factor [Armatimonadota bacterium]MDR7405131.1 ribosome recycling factor [Armatimonadota bacterium]MDR7437021.1 ribosome recycling factor [Armatimonadota bacterium]MDR7472908.1 ribosome recycling factor [Armatimonadota bacterium]
MAEVLADARTRMQKAVEATRHELAALRTGRASPALLEQIRVEYYGVPTPITQMATVTVPEPRLLVIQPWDRKFVKEVEKAILKSDLGLVPTSDGVHVRVPIPPLTEERRRELVKVAHKHAEEGRVAIRNVRREAKEMIERLEDDGEISEDEARRALDELQKLTDRFIGEIDALLQAKDKEIMEL